MTRHNAFALFADMGTGKSFCVLDEFSQECSKEDGLRDLLVIAPAGCYNNWVGELREHLDPELHQRLKWAVWKSGKKNAEVDALFSTNGGEVKPRVLIMNVEALSTVKKAREVCQRFLSAGRAIMVVDESTKIKNYRAARTKAVTAMSRLAKRRRILSGLPSPNGPLDLYSQFAFLDPYILNFHSFAAFRARYAVTQKVLFPGARWPTTLVKGYRNIDQLHEQIKPWSFRVSKEECLDLPPKIYMTRDVSLTPEQERLYRELKERATTELEEQGGHVTATIVIVKMLRLHQMLCGHVANEQGELREVPSNRDAELLDLLDEHSGKAIIWATYDYNIRKIADVLAKAYGDPNVVAQYWGGNASTRKEDELRWKMDPDCRFMVSTQSAGGLGNTWTEADLVIYYSNNFNLEHRMQSEDRAHRVGQSKSVTYVDLMARGTIDEKMIQALRQKIDLNTEITGETWREWLI